VKILVCNAGSSSLKFEAEDETLMAEGGIDWTTEPTLLLRCRRQWEIRADRELPNLSFPALELDQKRILPAGCRYCHARRGGTDPRRRHAPGFNGHTRDVARSASSMSQPRDIEPSLLPK